MLDSIIAYTGLAMAFASVILLPQEGEPWFYFFSMVTTIIIVSRFSRSIWVGIASAGMLMGMLKFLVMSRPDSMAYIVSCSFGTGLGAAIAILLLPLIIFQISEGEQFNALAFLEYYSTGTIAWDLYRHDISLGTPFTLFVWILRQVLQTIGYIFGYISVKLPFPGVSGLYHSIIWGFWSIIGKFNCGLDGIGAPCFRAVTWPTIYLASGTFLFAFIQWGIASLGLPVFFNYKPLFFAGVFVLGYSQYGSEFIDALVETAQSRKWVLAFVTLVAWKGVRALVHLYSYYVLTDRETYIPLVSRPHYRPSHVTVIVPSVGTFDAGFERTINSIHANSPRQIIVVTVGLAKLVQCKTVVANLNRIHGDQKIIVIALMEGAKHAQFIRAARDVQTELIAYADGNVIWPTTFLASALAPFSKAQVGLIGTAQTVIRNSTGSWADSFFNFTGTMFIKHYNFLNTATYNLDGGCSLISSRTALIRTDIVDSKSFRCGLLNANYGDEDHFITRYMLNHGWTTVFHNSPDAIVEVPMCGRGLLKFGNLVRALRSQFRSNFASLFRERYCWSVIPWTTYASFLYSFTSNLLSDILLFILLAFAGLEQCWLVLLSFLLATRVLERLGAVGAKWSDLGWIVLSAVAEFYVALLEIKAFFTVWIVDDVPVILGVTDELVDRATQQNGSQQNGNQQNGNHQNGNRQNSNQQNGTQQNGTQQNGNQRMPPPPPRQNGQQRPPPPTVHTATPSPVVSQNGTPSPPISQYSTGQRYSPVVQQNGRTPSPPISQYSTGQRYSPVNYQNGRTPSPSISQYSTGQSPSLITKRRQIEAQLQNSIEQQELPANASGGGLFSPITNFINRMFPSPPTRTHSPTIDTDIPYPTLPVDSDRRSSSGSSVSKSTNTSTNPNTPRTSPQRTGRTSTSPQATIATTTTTPVTTNVRIPAPAQRRGWFSWLEFLNAGLTPTQAPPSPPLRTEMTLAQWNALTPEQQDEIERSFQPENLPPRRGTRGRNSQSPAQSLRSSSATRLLRNTGSPPQQSFGPIRPSVERSPPRNGSQNRSQSGSQNGINRNYGSQRSNRSNSSSGGGVRIQSNNRSNASSSSSEGGIGI